MKYQNHSYNALIPPPEHTPPMLHSLNLKTNNQYSPALCIYKNEFAEVLKQYKQSVQSHVPKHPLLLP